MIPYEKWDRLSRVPSFGRLLIAPPLEGSRNPNMFLFDRSCTLPIIRVATSAELHEIAAVCWRDAKAAGRSSPYLHP